ncbi:glycylpeptide N-tetradecanoyltransferase [Friedmanniomyces endolithicus]|nr:glycylpeptide N-tetradecanoyltransferase [Friedmanniomyces endolithicus]
MNEHELRRKRPRVFAPSQSSGHITPRWDHSDQHAASMSTTRACPTFTRGAPPPPPSPSMARGVPGHLGAMNDSTSSKLSATTGKGKCIEIVDLTTDSASSQGSGTVLYNDDEEFARLLQAQYDDEDEDQSRPLPRTFPNDKVDSGTIIEASEALHDDERFARELQAELDRADILRIGGDERVTHRRQSGWINASSASAHYPSLSKSNEVHSSRQDGDAKAQDEAFARQLQAQYDGEDGPEASAIQDSNDEASTTDPLARRGLVQRFAEAVRHTGCASCGKSSLSSEKELLLKFKQWFEHTGNRNSVTHVSSVFRCSKAFCSAETCLGCGMQSKGRGTSSSVTLNDNYTLTWCCARGRMAIIWILLCGYDRRRTAERRRDSYFTKPTLSPSKGSSGAGVGYDSEYGHHPFMQMAQPINDGSISGMPSSMANMECTHLAIAIRPYGAYQPPQPVNYSKYGTSQPLGQYAPGRYAQPVDNPVASSIEAADDEITARLMACLDVLLPSLVNESVQDFDLEPPAILAAVLTQSNVLGTIAALLRNDSFEDATKRTRLYKITLDVVNKLGSHHATAGPTIHHSRQVQEGGPDILSLSFTPSHTNNKDVKFEGAQSLASCLHNFDKQSKNMLVNAKAHPQAFAGPDSEQMLSLCRGVSDLADFLLANAAPAPVPAANPGGPGQALPHANDDWQSDLAVLELPDEEIMSRHSYGQLARAAHNLAPNRMKSLSLQLSNLMTSLPPGIFVRHCASRLDVMKILIIGPKGTPYENGLFEFDLFCPSNFPHSPPSMLFRTTGGGRIRFNPNLYNCGKVCLSLLGTWQGESWQPGKSTILQVLVSIQAMIFCDEPWYNEPGRSANRIASMRHNQELQRYTVRHAMLDWLGPELDPVWGDVVERHFVTRGREIEGVVAGWGVHQGVRTQLMGAIGRLPS